MSGLNEETVGAMGLGLILAAASLLAVWAALSRRPWQYRCLVLVGILALLLFANVYEPILLFVIAWSVTIGGLVGMRWILRAIRLRRNSEPIPRPRGAPKFYLSDVLWLLALAPVTIAIVTRATRMSLNFPWSHLLVATGVLFVMTLTASCATLLVHRTPWRICWAVLFGAAVIVVLDVELDPLWSAEAFFWPIRGFNSVVVLTGAAITFVALLAWRGARRPTPIESVTMSWTRTAIRYLSRFAVASVLVVLVTFHGWLYVQLAFPPPIPAPIEDARPNHFTDIVAIATKLENVTIPDREMDGVEAFEGFSDDHADVLSEARLLLDGRCHPQLNYSRRDFDDPWFEEVFHLRQLARGMTAAGFDAELSGGDGDAIEYYLDAMRMGHAAAEDGLLVDLLVGIAIEGTGMHSLRELRSKLPPQQNAQLLGRLVQDREAFESVEAVCDRDLVWTAHACGWQGRYYLAMARLAGTERDSSPGIQRSVQRADALYRLLTCDLAVRAYQFQVGQLPETLVQLVPEFLPRVPQDPFGREPIRYRRNENDYVLYSVGENSVDDGGCVVTDGDGTVHRIHRQRRDAFLYPGSIDPAQSDLFLDSYDWTREPPPDAGAEDDE